MVWEGYELETGVYRGHEYGIVFPKKAAPGRPYIWRVEFFGAFPCVDLAMLGKGYAVVYYRIPDLYGSPEAVGKMEAFQPFVQEKYGLSAQAILFGFSRGGLYALHYAAKCPERVASLYLDAPVVDIYSWPGGYFSGEGSPGEWEECRALWDKTHEEFMEAVDLAAHTLLAWSVPLILVAGGKDEVVPYHENGALLQEIYEKGGGVFRLIMKEGCGHHPHSLNKPQPVVEFLLENKSTACIGNAFRINDQSITRYPLTLIVHDTGHLSLVMQAENAFSGKYPLGYIGTSPWPGSVTNQRTMEYGDAQNQELYGFLRAQMEIGWVIYGMGTGGGEGGSPNAQRQGGCGQAKKLKRGEKEILTMVRDMKEKCPGAKQIWMKKKSEMLSAVFLDALRKYGVLLEEYETWEDFGAWLKTFTEEVRQAQPTAWFDSLEREWAEWTNVSVTLPKEERENRILLVGDSISAGYGDMVQKRMPGWHVDRLNTSEGIHHPNFLRLLEIVLLRYPYRLVHINNGIHLHGQGVEQYGQNLLGVFAWIHMLSPETKIVFATTTPLSRSVEKGELQDMDAYHFSMGDKPPVAQDAQGEYWVLDEEASKIYRQLNEKATKLCARQGIPVNDLYQLCVKENLQKSDGVHFCQKAYERLADQIAKTLQKELCGFSE